MRQIFGLPFNTAAVVVGSLSLVIFLYATIHTTYNLVEFVTREKPPSPTWIIDPNTGEISHGIKRKPDDPNVPKAEYTGWIINTDTSEY